MRGRAERVHYLDWLRVLAVAGVFVYHTLRPFDDADWHVKNDQVSTGISLFLALLGSWGLAFFFFVSGAGTWLALRWRTAAGYVRERLLRLLVPLVVAYVLFSPLQFFIEEHHKGWYGDSYPDDVRRFFGDLWSGPPLWVRDSYHLWFLFYLLQFALLGLPLFSWLRGPRGRRLVGWFADRCERRGMILLLVVPLVPVHLLLQAAPGPDHGWSEFFFYFDFFVVGHVVLSDERLRAAVRRDLVPGLALGLAAFAISIGTGIIGFLDEWWDDPGYSWPYLWYFTLITFEVWGWLVGVLAFGMRARRFQRPLPLPVARAAMPFFLVHQPVILAIAYYVVRWDAGIPVKWAALFPAALVASAALAWLLSVLPGVSLLFGVKRRTGPRRAAGVEAA